MYTDPIRQLEREWQRLERRELAQALPAWAERHPELRRFSEPGQLLPFLHSARREESDPKLRALLSLARHDRLAGRFVLQAILPALKAQASRLRRGPASRDELWELLLFHAWEAICSYPLRRRHHQVAANLVLQVLHDTTRELSCPGRHRELAYPAAKIEFLAAEQHRQSGSSMSAVDERLLESAVEAGVIAEHDAELIFDTRVEGIRLRLLASVFEVSYWSLVKRRERAEASIRAWLRPNTHVQKNASQVLTSRATSRSTTRQARDHTRPHGRVERPERRVRAVTRSRPNIRRRPS